MRGRSVPTPACFHEEQVVALRQANSILLTTRLDLLRCGIVAAFWNT